jgi:hypothetical protein
MGPSCLNDGASLPVQVSSLVYRPCIIRLKGGVQESSCGSTNSRCSCQRIIDTWPFEPTDQATTHKSFRLPCDTYYMVLLL